MLLLSMNTEQWYCYCCNFYEYCRYKINPLLLSKMFVLLELVDFDAQAVVVVVVVVVVSEYPHHCCNYYNVNENDISDE